MRKALLAMLLVAIGWAAQAADLGFLGPRGTYTEQATDLYRSQVPGFDTTAPLPTITAVVEAVANGKIPRGIIPAVATTSGFPAETTRNLLAALDPRVRIVGEVNIPIDNDLMVKHGTRAEDVRTVISHPNALGEAAAWLKEHFPNAALREARSTAAAAEDVSKGDGTLAAVAGPAAAKLYGLDVLAEKIQDNRDNRTSFWAIVPAGRLPEAMPNRIAVNLDAPVGSHAFSVVVSGLHQIGFSVIDVNSAPLAGPLFGFRYMLVLAAPEPVAQGKVDELVDRVARGGGGHGLLIGAWRARP